MELSSFLGMRSHGCQGVVGRQLAAVLILMVVAGRCATECAGAQAKTQGAMTAQEWANAIGAIVGPDLLGTSQQEMMAKLKAMSPEYSESRGLTARSEEIGIESLEAGFQMKRPSQLTLYHLDITIHRTDPEGHRVYPGLRAVLARRFVGRGWRDGSSGNFGASWTNQRKGQYLEVVDDGATLKLTLAYTEDSEL